MILYLSFEELAALSASAESVLTGDDAAEHGIAAPVRIMAEVEQFAQRLVGDVVVSSLDEQESMLRVVRHLLYECRLRMDEAVLMDGSSGEAAIAAYFAYAHVLSVEKRLTVIGQEMSAIVHVVTGDESDSENGRRFLFPE
ncbi:MAG: hypothetical protein WEF86_13650 [Gemmatimonadota bacterium]